MIDDRELQRLRREARALQRAVASGDRVAEERASGVLGERVERRFVLADALHVVARENGATSWPVLVARARRGRVGAALDEELDAEGRSEVDVETGLDWPGGSRSSSPSADGSTGTCWTIAARRCAGRAGRPAGRPPRRRPPDARA